MRVTRAKSKAEHVRGVIREMIYSGDLSAGQRLPTELEMAERFGVSVVTINRAMSSLDAEKILHRAPGLGTYVREDIARGTVVVIMPVALVSGRTGGPFYAAAMTRLTQVFAARNLRAQFVLSSGDTDEDFLLSLHSESPLWSHATVVVGLSVPTELLRKRLVGPDTPIVSTASGPPGDAEGPCVVFDYYELGRRACRHLIAKGHRRIAILSPMLDGSEDPALAGMAEAMSEAGLPMQQELCMDLPHGDKEAQEMMWRLWSLPQRPDALIVCDDAVAVDVGRAIKQMGIRTPDELAVVAHATAGVDMGFPLPFTTCQYDLERMCRAMYGLVDRAVRGSHATRAVRMRPRIVAGETT